MCLWPESSYSLVWISLEFYTLFSLSLVFLGTSQPVDHSRTLQMQGAVVAFSPASAGRAPGWLESPVQGLTWNG